MTKKISKKLLIGASIIATVTIVPIVAVACGSETNQNDSSLSNLISKVESSSIIVNDKGKNILPSALTDKTINEYITGLPTLPASASYLFDIDSDKTNNANGSIALKIEILQNSQSEKTKLLTISGFLTNVQNTINQIKALPSNTIKANEAGSLISPSALTSSNIGTYITGVPAAPTGVVYSYALSFNNNQSGSINLTITATQGTISNSTSIVVLGFKISSVTESDNEIVTNIITSINSAATANTIKAKTNNNILPTQLTTSNIAQNITGIPVAPEGVTYTFALTEQNDNVGSISIVITVSKGSVTQPTNKISVQGFLTSTQANKAFEDTINSALSSNSIFAVPQNTTAAVSITNPSVFGILAPFIINSNGLNNLKAIPNLEISVSNSNLGAGTVDLTFTSNSTAANLSYKKSYTGFSTSDVATITTNIKNYLKTSSNALPLLSLYISLNPSWIENFIKDNNNGLFKSFRINSTTPLSLNSMTVSYNANGYFDIHGQLNNEIQLQSWDGANFKTTYQSTSETTVTLILPITFDTSTGQGAFSGLMAPINVNTASTGITTLSWALKLADGSEATFGMNLTNLTKTSDSTSVSTFNVPYKLAKDSQASTTPATIANIVF